MLQEYQQVACEYNHQGLQDLALYFKLSSQNRLPSQTSLDLRPIISKSHAAWDIGTRDRAGKVLGRNICDLSIVQGLTKTL